MSRTIYLAALGLLLVQAAASWNLIAAEKPTKGSPAEEKAKQGVLAALNAEAAGDNDRRRELLEGANHLAPELADANWHLGRVLVGDKWLELTEAETIAASDVQLAEYRKLRDEASGNPKLLRGLARWSMKIGWEDTARLHYAQLLGRSDIDADTLKEAIKRIGLLNVGGNWITDEAAKAQEERARAIDVAMRQWRPRLKKMQLAIDGEESSLRERSIKDLQSIDDSQAIIPIESFQMDGGDRFCEEAVKQLAKFPQVEATEALVRFAVLSPFSGAREAAIAGLKNRPKHDYIPILLSGLIAPIHFQYSVSVDSRGTIQYKHELSREDTSTRVVDVRDVVVTPALWALRRQKFIPASGQRHRAAMILAAASTHDAAREVGLAANSANLQAASANRHVFDALEQLAGVQIPRDANQWWNWWQDYNQYYWPKQTQYAYQRGSVPYQVGQIASCFLAGTFVRTETGLSPIESLRPGDRVLAQDQDTGELAYKVVLKTTTRPPARMARISTGSDEIVTTLGHPFWVNGHGWKMAKELASGDLLHSLGGAVRIEKVEPAGEEKAYNLVVDDFNTYFVGLQGLLVHDNEFRKPTRAIVPGLVEELAVAAKK